MPAATDDEPLKCPRQIAAAFLLTGDEQAVIEETDKYLYPDRARDWVRFYVRLGRASSHGKF